MKRKTPAEMRRHQVVKTVRALVRLKHSLAADEELNAVLPDTLEQFDAALSRHELKGLDVSGVIDDVIKG